MSKKRSKAAQRKRKKQRQKSKTKARKKTKTRTRQRQAKGSGSSRAESSPKRLDLTVEQLDALLDRAKASPLLTDEDRESLDSIGGTLKFLTQELQAKGTSINRLRKMLFGSTTEKTSQVVGEQKTASKDDEEQGTTNAPKTSAKDSDEKKKKKRKGHGRNGAADYPGAERVPVGHQSLQPGDRCPECLKGKVYELADPAVLVRVSGMAPLDAKVYECQRLRCNLCGEVFTAVAPEGVGDAKYDETAASMIGLLKYGCGLPFNRVERLERGFGIPLPASTQWEVVENAEKKLAVAFEELVRQAAQGEVLHNDDTTIKILEMMADASRGDSDSQSDSESDKRTGMFTSGVVAIGDGHRIALFFSGGQHAGKNLANVLEKRAADLATPIQMCDGLSHNTAGDFDTILANCIAHARRRFVDVSHNFPEEVKHVLEQLREVYKNDATTHEQRMSPEQRLEFHQARSKPIMDELKAWLEKQFKERLIEPTSGLGKAISYMTNHWDELTLFLRVAGAPLDNNCCERALKKAILHRKNSLFYKTRNGARVADTYMSLIHTCELNGIEAFDYLVAVQRHSEQVANAPDKWMPWNYNAALQDLKASSAHGAATP